MNETTTEPRARSRWPMVAYWVLAIGATVLGAGWYTQSGLLNTAVKGVMDSSSDTNLAGIELEHPDGSRQPLSDFQGRYVLLDFWASWCPYCRLSMPAYSALQKKHPDRLIVLAVNTQEPLSEGQAWMQQQDLDLTLVRSPQLVTALDIGVLPTSILLDPKGKRLWATVGFVPVITPTLLERELKP